ncbi:MAG: PTS sugar transporter subunit IIC [Treponemataceae bacterium]|nr:PTS sugar transporter subunit IIC [Treponemataceae bacterium]MDE7392480.1 PTS sugar transporter subunit IIC [Treponemataceae bacterium]
MNRYVKRYGVDALGGMALGLFSTLIIGLIIGQIGKFFPGAAALTETAGGGAKALVYAGQFLVKIGQLLTVFTGAGIAVGVAHALGAPKLAVYGSIVTGTIGAYAPAFIGAVTAQSFALVSQTGAITLAGPGDPLSAFVAALVGAELGRLVSGRTKVDILVVPAVTILSGAVVAVVLGPPLAAGARMLGNGINLATELQPFFMGIILSVVMGMILTLPISSAAIGIMLGLTGLAGGAATAGCSAQMIGFAVISFADNGFNGLFAQGIGTSMLQIPNIAKNPRIWIPPTLASAVTGPIATCLLKMKTLPAGSGMGTSGLVGQIMTYQAMAGESAAGVIIAKMLLIDFLLPAALSYAIYRYMLKKAWIRPGDMKLDA